ncbi:hypothetical protein M407DRAFT_242477 [Tulasnella calospora MUT 4182]|uniref:Uncharacterized protein n=1 Tax=Tulasnella calospora MUT 4182 TaxID=1051891 RepID=A0A0C3QNU0_9AGAM|nr:hypothetical protein M407DRAFT_242477 [Tulasnella calospora MUT 4182]
MKAAISVVGTFFSCYSGLDSCRIIDTGSAVGSKGLIRKGLHVYVNVLGRNVDRVGLVVMQRPVNEHPKV